LLERPEVEEFMIIPAHDVANRAVELQDQVEDDLAEAFPGLAFNLVIPEAANGQTFRLPDEWWVIPVMGSVGDGRSGSLCADPAPGLMLRIKAACEAMDLERRRLVA
jgi:hypothetical protein